MSKILPPLTIFFIPNKSVDYFFMAGLAKLAFSAILSACLSIESFDVFYISSCGWSSSRSRPSSETIGESFSDEQLWCSWGSWMWIVSLFLDFLPFLFLFGESFKGPSKVYLVFNFIDFLFFYPGDLFRELSPSSFSNWTAGPLLDSKVFVYCAESVFKCSSLLRISDN